jgi:3-oxoadipate enol-lactonase
MTRQSSSPVSLAHRVEGQPDGIPLVFVHSMAASLEQWEAVASRLAATHRVVRCDLRGHGGSAAPRGPWRIEELALDVLDLLDRLGVERASLCGISLGGMVAQWLGVNAPDRVDDLALVCTTAGFGTPGVFRDRAASVRLEGVEPQVSPSIDRWLSPRFRARYPQVVKQVRQRLLAMPPEAYAACCEAIGEWEIRPQLSKVQAPTLVVAAADDVITPTSASEEIVLGIGGNARLHVIEDSGHLVNLEQPEALVQALVSNLVR